MLLLSFVWQHCSDDQAPARPGESNVQFSMRAKSAITGRTATSLPEGASLYVSIRRVSGDEVYALTPFDRDGVAAEYAVVPADVLAPKPLRLSHVEAAALPMGGLTAWQALFVHGRLARGERVLVTGASGGVGHIAVQLARHAGAAVVESGPVDLVFDTRGGEVPAGERVVTIAEEMPGAIYFIVEPDHEQLLELRTLVDAGELRAEVDSVFPLTEARAAFERVAGRGKRGKVVLEVGTD
jgi:NADPH:quinone reductase-like Zn-dependent oxidoreductase